MCSMKHSSGLGVTLKYFAFSVYIRITLFINIEDLSCSLCFLSVEKTVKNVFWGLIFYIRTWSQFRIFFNNWFWIKIDFSMSFLVCQIAMSSAKQAVFVLSCRCMWNFPKFSFFSNKVH